jgi:LysM repeat protein
MIRSLVPRAPLRAWLFGGISVMFAVLPSTALALQSYVVQPGDTLSRIAVVNGVSVAELALANDITDVNHVNAGAHLLLPSASNAGLSPSVSTRTVQPGDTLSGIADEFGVDVTALAAANGITNPGLISVGQVLTVPSAGGSGNGESPASAPRPAALPGLATASYTVGAGDTLADIAARFGIDASALASSNGIQNANLIVVGQVLSVPAGPSGGQSTGTTPPTAVLPHLTHIVAEGETLSVIADQYHTTVAELVAANALTNPSFLSSGEALLVPSVVSAASRAEVRAILKSVEQEFALPDGLLQALAWQESGWQQQVTSGAGAVGVTQVLPTTALWALQFLVDGADNWQLSALDNARVGGSFLKHLLNLANGNVATAVAAYYQGWDSIQSKGMYDDTRQYVANVLALWPQFKS